jgi:hypothetical protein
MGLFSLYINAHVSPNLCLRPVKTRKNTNDYLTDKIKSNPLNLEVDYFKCFSMNL